MSTTRVIVAVAGWEERFALGTESDLLAHIPGECLIIVFEEFIAQTRANRHRIKELCSKMSVRYTEVRVPRSVPAQVWRQLQQIFAIAELEGKEVLINITTMPREVIWWSFRAFQSV